MVTFEWFNLVAFVLFIASMRFGKQRRWHDGYIIATFSIVVFILAQIIRFLVTQSVR